MIINYSNMYTLLGNSRANTFECNPGKDCEAYGAGGEDEFYYRIQPNNLYIRDFKENRNDGDKIYLPRGYKDITVSQDVPGTITITASYETKSAQTTRYTRAILKNTRWSLGEVEGGVEVATGRYRNTEEGRLLEEPEWRKRQEKNPIQIK